MSILRLNDNKKWEPDVYWIQKQSRELTVITLDVSYVPDNVPILFTGRNNYNWDTILTGALVFTSGKSDVKITDSKSSLSATISGNIVTIQCASTYIYLDFISRYPIS